MAGATEWTRPTLCNLLRKIGLSALMAGEATNRKRYSNAPSAGSVRRESSAAFAGADRASVDRAGQDPIAPPTRRFRKLRESQSHLLSRRRHRQNNRRLAWTIGVPRCSIDSNHRVAPAMLGHSTSTAQRADRGRELRQRYLSERSGTVPSRRRGKNPSSRGASSVDGLVEP